MSDVFLEATAAYHREMPPEPIDRDAAIAAQTDRIAATIRALLQEPDWMLTKREEALRDDVLAHLHGSIADAPLAAMVRIASTNPSCDLLTVFQAYIESAIEYQARKLAVVEVERAEYESQNN